MKRFLPLILVLASCAVDPVTPKPDPYAHRQHQVQVVSDPPGARIEVNGNYIGTAPCTVDVEVLGKGYDSIYRDHTFVASPVINGQQVQMKHFRHLSIAPRTVFFDMNLVRPRQQIDVQLH